MAPKLKSDRESPQNASNGNNLAAGGGAGGLLVYLINTFIADASIRDILMYLVPSASIVIAWCYSFLASTVGGWISYRLAASALRKTKNHLTLIEGDPNATQQHKKEARERVEEAERALMVLGLRDVRR